MYYPTLSPFEFFQRATVVARRLNVTYGDPIPVGDANPGRTWDCSWFIATVLRYVLGLPDLFRGAAGVQATTHGLAGYCVPVHLAHYVGGSIPLIFLHDSESTAWASKMVHVGLLAPDARWFNHLRHPEGRECEGLTVCDLRGIPTACRPQNGKVADWFSNPSVAPTLREVSFSGQAAPDFGSDRYVLTIAALPVQQFAEQEDLR